MLCASQHLETHIATHVLDRQWKMAVDLLGPGAGAAELPRWVDDDAVQSCTLCVREFGMFFRRHHCR